MRSPYNQRDRKGRNFSGKYQIITTFATMKIGPIDLGDRPVTLAPMEDVTDASFRILCREAGAAMVTTEFVSSDGPGV